MLQGQLRGEPKGLCYALVAREAQSVAVFSTGACCSPAEVRASCFNQETAMPMPCCPNPVQSRQVERLCSSCSKPFCEGGGCARGWMETSVVRLKERQRRDVQHFSYHPLKPKGKGDAGQKAVSPTGIEPAPLSVEPIHFEEKCV